jgi:hypothetical protein
MPSVCIPLHHSGAGPYGIATAGYAKYLGVPVTLVGKTLDFWKTNMPRGMFLRSGPDWHVDARDVVTFEAYLNMGGLMHAHVKPVPLDMFLGLCELVHGTV